MSPYPDSQKPPQLVGPDGTIDAQTLATLIDGRVDGAERERLLAELALTPEAVESYADVLALMEEMHSGSRDPMDPVSNPAPAKMRVDRGQPTGIAPVVRERASGVPRWVAVALAASLLISIGLVFERQRNRPTELDAPSTLLAQLSPAERGSGAPGSAFAVRRGSSSAGTDQGRAIRLGAGATDAMLQLAAHDSAMYASIGTVAGLLDGMAGGTAAASAFRRLESLPLDSSTAPKLGEATTVAEQFVDARGFRIGAWLTTVRVATRARDSVYLRSRSSRSALKATKQFAAAQPAAAKLVAELAALMEAPALDWNAIDLRTQEVLRALDR